MASSNGWHAVTTSRHAHHFGDETRSACGAFGNAWIVAADRLPKKCAGCRAALKGEEGELF